MPARVAAVSVSRRAPSGQVPVGGELTCTLVVLSRYATKSVKSADAGRMKRIGRFAKEEISMISHRSIVATILALGMILAILAASGHVPAPQTDETGRTEDIVGPSLEVTIALGAMIEPEGSRMA